MVAVICAKYTPKVPGIVATCICTMAAAMATTHPHPPSGGVGEELVMGADGMRDGVCSDQGLTNNYLQLLWYTEVA